MKIKKWYRGHSSKRNALDNFGIIWLTDEVEYAQVYAEDDGVVSAVYIDEEKLKPADWWDNLDFEPYFPDDEEIDEFKNEGCNCYYFTASYGYDDYQCLALFDKTAVVKVEIEQLRLDDNEQDYIVSEVIKRLNETTDNTDYQQFINNVLAEINEYLADFGLSCSLNPKYDFSGYYKNCVAIYQYRSVMNNGKMRVAINLPLIMSQDDIDIEEQIRISLWHEVGHGIVQWIKSLRRKDTQMKTGIFKGQIVKDLRYIINNEEDVVEEFGEYQSDLASYSILNYFICDYNEILKPE
jgi:hypothetical protein